MSASSRIKGGLDVLASVGMLLAAAAVVGTYLKRPAPPAQITVPDSRPVPKQPVSLTDAAIAGSRGAKVAIVGYSDFQCPFCARFAIDTLPKLQEKYLRSGKVLFAFKHLPLEEIHPVARRAAELAACAGQQGQFWPAHDFIFNHQATLSEKSVLEWADRVGLRRKEMQACVSGAGAVLVKGNLADAGTLGVGSTPTFLLGRVGSDMQVTVTSRLDGAVPLSRFETALDNLLGTR